MLVETLQTDQIISRNTETATQSQANIGGYFSVEEEGITYVFEVVGHHRLKPGALFRDLVEGKHVGFLNSLDSVKSDDLIEENIIFPLKEIAYLPTRSHG